MGRVGSMSAWQREAGILTRMKADGIDMFRLCFFLRECYKQLKIFRFGGLHW
jgi:hypothetical protein